MLARSLVNNLKKLETGFDHLKLTNARIVTEHEPKTTIKTWHKVVGKFIAGVFSLGCGVTGVAGMAASISLTGVPLVLMAVTLGFSSFYSNYFMTRKDVPKFISLGLINLFKTEGPTLSLIGIDAMNEGELAHTLKTISQHWQKQNVDIDETDIVVSKNKNNPRKIDLSFVIPDTDPEVIYSLMSHFHNALAAEDWDNEPSKFINLPRRIALCVAMALTIGFGTAIGALTWSSVVGLPATFPIIGVVLGASLPFVAGFIGVVTFACLAALMMKTSADMIKVPNHWKKIAKIFKAHDNETDLHHGLRVTAIVVLGGGALALAAYGVFSMLTFCKEGFGNIISNIPGISAGAVSITSAIIVQGTAFVAQIPFMAKTSFGTIANAINNWTLPKIVAKIDNKITTKNAALKEEGRTSLLWQGIQSIWNLGAKVFDHGCYLLNAPANGFLSVHGQPWNPVTIFAMIGGTINSFFATFGNALAGNKTPIPTDGAEPVASSTGSITKRMNISPSSLQHSDAANDKKKPDLARHPKYAALNSLQIEDEIILNSLTSHTSYHRLGAK